MPGLAQTPAPGGLLLGGQQHGVHGAGTRAAHELGVGGIDAGQHLNGETRQVGHDRLPDRFDVGE
ncbi:hypothetical protein D3C72_2114310 [compost metagenome]